MDRLDAARYRQAAQHCRDMAAETTAADFRAQWLVLADEYEQLAGSPQCATGRDAGRHW
jgi:hypothetical protein